MELATIREVSEYSTHFRELIQDAIIDSYTELSYSSTKFIVAILQGAITLNDSFLELMKMGYNIGATPMIRMQVDNCLTTFASTIYPNKEVFYKHYKEGKINQLKLDGKPLTSNYLKEELEKAEPFFDYISKLYQDSCNYIHPTSYQYKEVIDDKDDGLLIVDEAVPMITDQEELDGICELEDVSNDWYDDMFWDMNSANDALIYLAKKIVQGIKDTKPTSTEYRTHKLCFLSSAGIENEIKIYKE